MPCGNKFLRPIEVSAVIVEPHCDFGRKSGETNSCFVLMRPPVPGRYEGLRRIELSPIMIESHSLVPHEQSIKEAIEFAEGRLAVAV